MKNSKLSFIIIIVYILTFSFITTNLNTPYLWFDEAGQFFISKGLNHDSNPLEKEKGLTDVVNNNAIYNLDPGGFSVLLHFWSKISNSHIWLRILPFLFFIGVVLSFIYLLYKWLKNIHVALLLGFIPILTPVIISMGFEIRAYSMETLGAIIGIVALEKLKSNITYKNLFIWSCILSFFITSRYSEIVIVFIISLFILYLIYNSDLSIKQKIISSFIYTLPLLVTLIYIYFSALVFQNKNIDPVSYLPYISSNKGILYTPLINLLYLIIIGLLIVLFFLRNKYPAIKKHQMLLLITVSINILFVILSYFGKYPWAPFSNRCISFFSITLLCLTAFLGEFIVSSLKNRVNVKYYLMVLLLLVTLGIRKKTLIIRHRHDNTFYDISNNNISKFSRIYVDRWESPCIRYLFEYGKLSINSSGLYPEKFTFGKLSQKELNENNLSLEEFYRNQPKMNDFIDYDLLITPELYRYGFNDKWQVIKGTKNLYIQRNTNLNALK